MDTRTKKTPFIVAGIGIVIIMVFQNVKSLGLIGLILFGVGMVLVTMEMHRRDCAMLIDDINQNLKQLNFTDEEIEERQNELVASTKPQLKQRKRQTEDEIERQKTNDFFDQLDK